MEAIKKHMSMLHITEEMVRVVHCKPISYEEMVRVVHCKPISMRKSDGIIVNGAMRTRRPK